MEFVVGKNKKTYDLNYLFNTLGDIKFDKYSLEELKKMPSAKLNKILKEERNITPVTRWTKDEKIIVILFGHSGRCNHLMTNDNGDFVGLCKKKPSSDDNGDSNGRCDIMGGKKKSTSRRKTGGTTSQQMLGNNNSLKTGVYYTGKAKIPEQQIKIYENLQDEDELTILKRRIRFLESQLQFITETIGIEFVNEEILENEYLKEQIFEEDEENNKQIIKAKTLSKRKKTMLWEQYILTVEQIRKTTETIKKLEKEMITEDENDELNVNININGLNMEKFLGVSKDTGEQNEDKKE